MELTFNKQVDKYVAEFEATSDFSLHIEKNGGRMVIFQSSVEGSQYDYVNGGTISEGNGVFDSDFTALVYPKYIKVVADVEPTLAVVTFAE